MPNLHILVVDDDARLRRLLQQYLMREGYYVTTAANTKEAEELLSVFECDAIVLDRMMPEEDGLDFLRRKKKEWPMPVLMLSAMGEADDRIAGLEEGAEDYLPKPFEPKELKLRLEILMKRYRKVQEIRFGDFAFYSESGRLMQNDKPMHLTDAEGAILKAMLTKPGIAISREELAQYLDIASDRAVDVHIARLRRKIEVEPRQPRHLCTVRGEGYVFYP